MNVLLLYPRFPSTFWSMQHALRFVRKRSAMPPLGLITVAAMLPADWTLRLIDLNIRKLTEADLAWADVAMISAMSVQKPSARELIARCRARQVPIIAGGPMFSAEPEEFEDVDHLVLNEAEVTLPEFLEDFTRGRARHLYTSPSFADIQKTPVPRWDLLELKHYFTMEIQYSRGCPYNCDFCQVTSLFGRRPRTKTAGQVVAELDSLRRLGWRSGVFFVDDNLVGNRKLVGTELLPALAAWQSRQKPPHNTFNTQATINIADDPKLLKLLSEAGFDMVFVGIETPDNQGLIECGKVQNRRRDMVADVKTIQRAGIQVQGGFIVGFDSDDETIFNRQVEFIQSSGIATAMVGMLQALPGTRLSDRMKRAGRLVEPSSSGNNVDGTTNILPLMGMTQLHEGYRRVLESIYSPRSYYRRVRTFLREYRLPKLHGGISFNGFYAFCRAALVLGVLGRERVDYWYTLAWTLLRRPRLFSHAVTLAISGHHLRRVCESSLQTPPAAS
ncbi:MAG: B12-binding domain-containing radical SAM protein [Phycisphaeraceae bacterium]|nr:B12-binding domain-containing radical SAM protein [Phycisphaeraceae bacterium]